MSTAQLIDRLEGVKPTGQGRWIARCPAHDDRRPSLSVRELDDGRVLLHCFAGCPVEDVLGAFGLEFDALFPRRRIENAPSERRPFPAADVLAALADEAHLVAVAAANIAQGVSLTDDDRARLMTAAERIESARRLALA